ncbi:MAG: polysaccharide biosynthesis C-terminal domain-containing protein, partial [Planctomycetaceae bacterium]|nr:polysaccharide biosynthesis C-terminal domain-containing protein [Planctomycetaceae bacterium]
FFTGNSGTTIWWLGHHFSYPVHTGAVSAIYFSERLYEFPQGLIGLAVATAIYPLLSAHCARQNKKAFGEDLTLGLRIVLVFAIPAGVGLMLFSDNLVHLLFQRGEFSANDTARTADMVFGFSTGVWAFCAQPVLVRAFYVLGDIKTPFRIGLSCCLLNVLICIVFLWKFKEQGLAVSASVSAGIQAVLLFLFFAVKHGFIDYKAIIISVLRACAATVLMALAVEFVFELIPGNNSLADIVHIFLGGIVALFIFFTVYRFLGGREPGVFRPSSF